jgi:putative protein kinase ArgK-like GTPase of G3E family
VTLTGIGGIGKSSLANAAVRQVIRHFHYDRIIWLSLTRNRPTTRTCPRLPYLTLN